MNNKSINYNIELLRVISMISILILHFLGNGNVLRNVNYCSINYFITWGLECLCFCSINCFALISGFLTNKKKNVYGSLVYNWITTIFYSFFLALIITMALSYPIGNVKNYLFPFFQKYNWYFVSYVIISLFQPIIFLYHKYISHYLDIIILLLSFILLSILPVFGIDILHVDTGYSTIWLLYLYLVGGFISKYIDSCKISRNCLVIVFIGCLFTMLASKIYIGYKTYPLDTNYVFNQLITYNSPTVFIMSLSLFILILQTKFNFAEKTKKMISFYSKSSFSSYIIQVHPMLWPLYANCFEFLGKANPLLLITSIIIAVLLSYTIISLIDYLRRIIFKYLKIDSLSSKIARLFSN